MIRLARIAAATALLTLAAAPSASAVVTQLGPRPAVGGAGGIYGFASPDILHIGDTQNVIMVTTWSTFYSPNAQFGPWIGRTSTPLINSSGLALQGPPCETRIYAGTTACSLKATGPTGGWRTHGFKIQLHGLGGSAVYQVPYAVLPPDVYNISGKFEKLNPAEVRPTAQKVPAAGVPVIVERVGGTEKYETTTNADGIYDVQVEAGTWRVRTSEKGFCWDGSGATCVRQPTTTTGGDKTVNFSAPKPVKISGTVTTKDAAKVKDAWILAKWTDADGVARHVEDKSTATGTYVLDGIDPGADVTIKALDANVCVQLESGTNELDDTGRCRVKERTLTPQVDTTVDFTKPGCVGKLDYQTSMVATGQCFQTTEPERYESEKAFRMNGLDFTPHGDDTVAKFDSARRTVAFDGGGWWAITLPFKGTSIPVGALLADGSAFTFETPLTKFAFSVANSGGGIPASATKMQKLAGFPVTAQESIEMGPAGVSTVAVKLAVPGDFAQQYKWSILDNAFKDGKGQDGKTVGVTAKVTTDNTSGATALEGKLDGIAAAGPTFKKVFNNKIFALKEVKLAYSWTLDQWTIGGKIELNFLKGKSDLKQDDDGNATDNWGTITIPGATAGAAPVVVDDEVAKSLEASVVTTGIPGFGGVFETASFSLDGLNKRGPMGLYFQRGGATIPLRAWDSNGAGKASVKLGVSAGPKNADAKSATIPFLGSVPIKPSEFASLDGELSASWSNFNVDDANPVTLSGKFDAKIWDQPIGSGQLSLYPNQGLIGGNLNVGFTDPTGGSLVSVRSGIGEFWYDQRRMAGIGGFYVWARTNMSIRGHGVYGDVIIEGPAPTRIGACGDVFGVKMGGVYDYDGQSLSGNASCDLSAFKADKPVPIPPAAPAQARRAAAQGQLKRFKVKPGQAVVVAKIATAAGGPGKVPSLELRGPRGPKVALAGDKSVSTAKLVTLLDPLESSMTIVLKDPAAGTWTVKAVGAGAPALAAPKFAAPLADPEVSAQVDASRCSPKVTWSAKGVKDQTLRFVERTAGDSGRVIAEITPTTKSAKGSLTVTPLPGAGRADISVVVMNGGTPRSTIELGSYTSEASATLAGPSNVQFKKAPPLKVKQGKKTVTRKATTLSWLPVCGATAYDVQVGKAGPVRVGTGTTLTIPRPTKGKRVVVTTIGPNAVPGGSTLVEYR